MLGLRILKPNNFMSLLYFAGVRGWVRTPHFDAGRLE